MEAVERFAREAELFEAWAKDGKDSGAQAARNGLIRMTQLYAAALSLPAADSDNESLPDFSVDNAEWHVVYAHAARLPLDYYGEVFNPLPVPAEEPVIGSMADDIADIYRNVVTGTRLFRAGHSQEAIWHWTFSLEVHWGEHITGAIRALHCWIAKNEPSQFTAGHKHA